LFSSFFSSELIGLCFYAHVQSTTHENSCQQFLKFFFTFFKKRFQKEFSELFLPFQAFEMQFLWFSFLGKEIKDV